MRRERTTLRLEARVADGPAEFAFETADGVHSKDAFRPAELLLAETLWDADPGRLLCPQANYGVVGTLLVPAAESVAMTESSARAAELCRRNAARNGVDATTVVAPDASSVDGPFDVAAYAPKPYTPLAVGKQRIAAALSAVRPGGRLYLAAAPDAGASRYESCLNRLTDGAAQVAERGDCRLLRAVRPETVESPTYVRPEVRTVAVDGVELSLVTVPGVFAASGLDAGTRLLLETASVADGDRVLDLCCGYGPAGAYAARSADCEVWLTDDDSVATACAECTLDATGVDGEVVTADCTDGVTDLTFDLVLCNPPTHAGSDVLSGLFAGARNVVAPDGRLLVVHHRALDLSAHFRSFGRVRTAATGPEHVVLRLEP